jgi:hypothetical protein
MNKNLTVIYVTQNTEDKKFESKIIKKLRESSAGLPIISISRIPIKLGTNICVGEVPVCDSAFIKQTLKGLLAVKTDYAMLTTCGYLYPPEFFTFTPPADTVAYRYPNVWTLSGKFWKNRCSDYVQMAGRNYWIKMIKKAMRGHKGWKSFDPPQVFPIANESTWTGENPVVHLITPHTTWRFANIDRHVLPKTGFPLWGTIDELKTTLEI